MAIKVEVIGNMRQVLQDLAAPEPTEVTQKKAIELLGKELRTKQRAGWSYEQLAELLSKNGIKIGPGTLRSYLNENKPKRSKKGVGGVQPKRQQSAGAGEASAVSAGTNGAATAGSAVGKQGRGLGQDSNAPGG